MLAGRAVSGQWVQQRAQPLQRSGIKRGISLRMGALSLKALLRAGSSPEAR